jgi:hypothetical protein
MDCGRLHDFSLQAFTLQHPKNRCSSDTGLNCWRNRSQKFEMMGFLPLLTPHRLCVTTSSKIYAGLSRKDDEPKKKKKTLPLINRSNLNSLLDQRNAVQSSRSGLR